MKRTTAGLVAAGTLMLAACASMTDVIPTGPDTYAVASHDQTGLTSGSQQRAKVLQRALDYCSGLGQQLETIGASDSGTAGPGTVSSAQVQFRCVNAPAH